MLKKYIDSFEMKLQTEYFKYIKYGTKRVEIRLYDEKRRQIGVGDFIKFRDVESNDTVNTVVVDRHLFESVEELVDNYDISLIASKDVSKESVLNDLNKYYSLEEQKEYGVVALEIDVCEDL